MHSLRMPITTTGADNPELLTPGEVAARLRVSPHTLRRWRYQANAPLRHVMVGGRARYRAADVDALLAPTTDRAAS